MELFLQRKHEATVPPTYHVFMNLCPSFKQHKSFWSIVSTATCTGMFTYTPCLAGVDCGPVAFPMMDYLQLFLVVLIVEARFPEGTKINDKKTNLTVGPSIWHLGKREIWVVPYSGIFSNRKLGTGKWFNGFWRPKVAQTDKGGVENTCRDSDCSFFMPFLIICPMPSVKFSRILLFWEMFVSCDNEVLGTLAL